MVLDMKSAAKIPVRGLVTGCEHGLTFQAVRTEEDLEGRDHSPRVKINFTVAAPGWLPPLFPQTMSKTLSLAWRSFQSRKGEERRHSSVLLRLAGMLGQRDSQGKG